MSYSNAVYDMLNSYIKKEEEEGNKIKVNAYRKAKKNLTNVVIKSLSDVEGIPGIGPKIKQKIAHVIETTEPVAINDADDLRVIYGIGDKTMDKLYNMGIKKIAQLESDPKKYLNAKQQLGLIYYKDTMQRIPFTEMVEHDKKIMELLRKVKGIKCSTIVGSYRRNSETSGDIDVLVKAEDPNSDIMQNIVKTFTDSGYIIATYACKSKKFMGVVKLNDVNIARRLDILITPPKEYPFALLYFTGSKDHNVMMRSRASAMGYRLNEHGINGVNDVKFETEEDIFNFLEIPYVEPSER